MELRKETFSPFIAITFEGYFRECALAICIYARQHIFLPRAQARRKRTRSEEPELIDKEFVDLRDFLRRSSRFLSRRQSAISAVIKLPDTYTRSPLPQLRDFHVPRRAGAENTALPFISIKAC